MISINTKRLTISPMTESEMTELINKYREGDPELSAAYQEMLDGCTAHPAQYVWYCAWKLLQKDGQKQIGDLCFKGFHQGSPEIGYGVNHEYGGKGYATEGVKALCAWAFSMPGVVSIEAEAAPDNEASNRVLCKVGFVPTGEVGAEGPRYRLEKAKFCDGRAASNEVTPHL